MSDARRKWIKVALQAAISACLVVIVVRQPGLANAMAQALSPLALPWMLAALLLFNLSKVASALRLNTYQRGAAVLLGERENLRLYYAGMFMNLFLPGGIGGDGYKILVLRRRLAAPVRTLLRVTFADRANGLLVLLILLCLSVPMLALPFAGNAVHLLAAGSAVALAAVIVPAHRRLLKMDHGTVAAVAAYGLAVQVLQMAAMGMLLAYLDVPPQHYMAYLSVFLLSSVAAVLPLSLGGLGAREATFLYGLRLLELDPAPGVVAASGFFVLTVVSSLAGALFLTDRSAP